MAKEATEKSGIAVGLNKGHVSRTSKVPDSPEEDVDGLRSIFEHRW
jgi:hypothetical protein